MVDRSSPVSETVLQNPQYIVEGIILRRLHQKRIEGYTIETAKEIVAALDGLAQTPNPGCSNSLCVYYRGLADTSTDRPDPTAQARATGTFWVEGSK